MGLLNMLSASICTKMPTLYSYQNSCPAGPGGFLETKFNRFFFLAKDFWICILDL